MTIQPIGWLALGNDDKFYKDKRQVNKGNPQGSVGMDANLLPFQAIQLGAWIARTTNNGDKTQRLEGTISAGNKPQR